MEFSIHSPAGGELTVIRNVEDQNLPCKLLTSQTDMVRGNFGAMYFHHVPCPDFSIWSSVYDIHQPTTLRGRANIPLLEIHGSLENGLHTSWEGFSSVHQRQDQYNLSFTPHVDNTVEFLPGRRCRTMDFHPSIHLLRHYAPAYPLLDKFLNKVDKNQPCKLVTSDFIIPRFMRDCLDRIIHYPYNPSSAGFYYEAAVKEFIITFLDHATLIQSGNKTNPKFTASQIEATHAARILLTADLAKPPTITQLVKKVHLNECTLKKCFRHLYGTSIHQFYITERMKKARLLLLDTSYTIDDIWNMLGYSDKQNFYLDFKKRINKTPRQWIQENAIPRKDIQLPSDPPSNCHLDRAK